MSDTQRVPTRDTACVPANRLRQSPKNVRRTHKAPRIESLAASILRRGLLQNLVVSVEMADDGEVFPVDAGERRRLAIGLLVERGKIPADWPVRVCIVDEADRTGASAAENIQREGMHPADQYEAFSQLVAEGCTIDQIADEYSVTPLVVERRLGLARAAPALLELLRADEITTEQLTALCATDDHDRQESVWRNSPTWDRHPYNLRRAVLAGDVPTTDARVAFIGGIEAFTAAGGEVRRDLFSGEGTGGFISDVPLLTRLVAEKLEATGEEVRAEGWGWVEVWPEWADTEFYRLGRISHTTLPMDPETSARVASLCDEQAALRAEADALTETLEAEDFEEEEFEEEPFEEEAFDEDDDSGAAERPHGPEDDRLNGLYARITELEHEIAAIQRAHLGYDAEAMAASGAVVGFERGKLRVERGLVRTADRAAATEAVGIAGAVVGGRETQVGGRKGEGLSDALTRSLFGYRNLAAQTATAAHPHIAKALFACWIVQTIRNRYASGVPVDLRIGEGSGTRTQHPITDEGGKAALAAFERLGTELVARLPADPDALWDALVQSSAAELDALIAFAVASSVSVDREHKGLTGRLLETLGFDMADHFVATAANYFSRVSKTQILDAMTEAGAVADGAQRSSLLGLKKGELAAQAERALAQTRWIPATIRTPGAPVAAAVEASSAAEVAGAATDAGSPADGAVRPSAVDEARAEEDGAPPPEPGEAEPADTGAAPGEAPLPAEATGEHVPTDDPSAGPLVEAAAATPGKRSRNHGAAGKPRKKASKAPGDGDASEPARTPEAPPSTKRSRASSRTRRKQTTA